MLDGKMLYYKKVNVSTYTEGERWKDIDRQTDPPQLWKRSEPSHSMEPILTTTPLSWIVSRPL